MYSTTLSAFNNSNSYYSSTYSIPTSNAPDPFNYTLNNSNNNTGINNNMNNNYSNNISNNSNSNSNRSHSALLPALIPASSPSLSTIPNISSIIKTKSHLPEHPEIVILFQAAEIERLTTLLSNYKYSDKMQSKDYLDRHSYQTQVKELSEILEDVRNQRDRLQRRVTEMTAFINKNIPQNNNENGNLNQNNKMLSNKYEKALLEIAKMYDDNHKLQQQINQLNVQLVQMKNRCIEYDTIINNYQKINNNNNNNSSTININKQNDELSIQKLKRQVIEIQNKHSSVIAQIRNTFALEMGEYRKRMQQKNMIKKQQLQEQLTKAMFKISQLNSQIHNQSNQKYSIETSLRQLEIKLYECQAKFRNCLIQKERLMRENEELGRVRAELEICLEQRDRQREKQREREKQRSLSLSLSVGPSLINSINNNNNNNRVSLNANNENSVNSSYNPTSLPTTHSIPTIPYNNNSINPNSPATTNPQQLQNKIAMLSQQLQRLTQLLTQKNTTISNLEQTSKQHQRNIGKLQKDLINIRMSYQSDIRRQRERYGELQERSAKDINTFRQKIQKYQMEIHENTYKYQQNILIIKQQQRGRCEQISTQKLSTVQLELNRVRQQLSYTKKKNYEFGIEVDRLQSQLSTQKQQMYRKQSMFNQKLRENQSQYERKLKVIEQDMRKNSQIYEQKIHEIRSKGKQQKDKIGKQLERQLQQRVQHAVRDKERQGIEKSNSIKIEWENKLRGIQREYKEKLNNLESAILEKQRIIAQMGIKIGSYESAQQQYRSSQIGYRQLLDKLSNLSLQVKQTKSQLKHQLSNLQLALPSSNPAPIPPPSSPSPILLNSLPMIQQKLQKIFTQMSTISSNLFQIQLTLASPNNTHIHNNSSSSPMTTYYEQYTKQLQNQCDNYLKIIHNKTISSQNTLNYIWEQIQYNNRYNREQWAKLRTVVENNSGVVEDVGYFKGLAEYYKKEIERSRNAEQEKQQKYEQLLQKYTKQQQNQIQARTQLTQFQHQHQTVNSQLSTLKLTFNALQQQLIAKSHTLQQYQQNTMKLNKINQQLKMQLEEMERQFRGMKGNNGDLERQMGKLIQIIEGKSRELMGLGGKVAEYQEKYQRVKEDLGAMQKIINRLIKDSKADIKNMQILQKDNRQLRQQIKRTNTELILQKSNKTAITQQCQQKVINITKQLTQSYQQNLQTLSQSNQTQTSQLVALQQSLINLQQIVHKLKKLNYQLTKQNYDESAQNYINKQFNNAKVLELNRENQRLIYEGIELRDQLQRCRLELVAWMGKQKGLQENLALYVMMVVQIQALRRRLENYQKQSKMEHNRYIGGVIADLDINNNRNKNITRNISMAELRTQMPTGKQEGIGIFGNNKTSTKAKYY